jgi:hypothetical protein
MKEETLSDKRKKRYTIVNEDESITEYYSYAEEDVKEFIKKLKESFGKGSHKYFTPRSIKDHIDKLAGDKLTKEKEQ